MMEKIIQLFRYLRRNIAKILTMLVAFLIFSFLLFPLDDLSDLVSSQISKASQNSVYLQFEKMKMSFFPQPGIRVEEVFIETIQMPPLTAKEVVLSPSASGFINKQPYGHFSASGILGGQIDIWLGKGQRTESGLERHKLELSAKEINLQSVRNLADLPVLLKGQLNLEGAVVADFNFADQPEGDISINIDKFELPPSNIPTDMGPLSLPEMKLSQLNLKGHISAGKFIIEEGVLGKEGDELHGKIKGDLGLRIAPGPMGGMEPQFGAYGMDLHFSVKKSFQDKAALFLSFLDAGKTVTSEGATYKLKVAAPNSQVPPAITPIK